MHKYLIGENEVTFDNVLEAADALEQAEKDGISWKRIDAGPLTEADDKVLDPEPNFQLGTAASADVVSKDSPAQDPPLDSDSTSENGSSESENQPKESLRYVQLEGQKVYESEYPKIAGTKDNFPESFEDFAELYQQPIKDGADAVYEGGELDAIYINNSKVNGKDLISVDDEGIFKIDYDKGLADMPVLEGDVTQENYVPKKKKRFQPNWAAKESNAFRDQFQGIEEVENYNRKVDDVNINISAEERKQRVFFRDVEMIAARDIFENNPELNISTENTIAAGVDINDPEQNQEMANLLTQKIDGMSLGRAEYLVSTYNDEKLAVARANEASRNAEIISKLPDEEYGILLENSIKKLYVKAGDVYTARQELNDAKTAVLFPELDISAIDKYALIQKQEAAEENYLAAIDKYQEGGSVLEYDTKGNLLGVKEKPEGESTPLYDFKGNKLTDMQVQANIDGGGTTKMYDMQGRLFDLAEGLLDKVTDRQKLKDTYTVNLVQQQRLNLEGQEVIWAKKSDYSGVFSAINDPSFLFDAHLDKSKPKGSQYSVDKDGWIGHTQEVWAEMVASGDWNAEEYRWRDGKKRTNDEFKEFAEAQRDANLKTPLLAEMVVLGIDPKSYGENGIKEGFTTFVEGALDNTPFIGKYVAKEWQSDVDKKATLSKIFSDTGVTPTEEMANAFYLNYGMKLVNGMGAFMPVIGEFALATAVTGGVGSARGVLGALGATKKLEKMLQTGTRAQKLAAHFSLGLLEEAKFSMVAGGKNEAGGGFGFYAGGALFGKYTKFLRFPKEHAYANNILNKVVLAGAGGVAGQEMAMLTEAFYKSFKGDKTFQKSLQETYGKDSQWMERLSMGALQFGALGASKLRLKDFSMLGKVEANYADAVMSLSKIEGKKELTEADKAEKSRLETVIYEAKVILHQAETEIENASINSLTQTSDAITRMMNSGKDLLGNPLSPKTKRFMNKRLDEVKTKQDNIQKELNSQIENFNKEFKGENITFEFKELPNGTRGEVDGEIGKGDVKILIDPKQANTGTVVQELTHLAFEGVTKNNPEIKVAMVKSIEAKVDTAVEQAKANGYLKFEGTFRQRIEKNYEKLDEYGQSEEYLSNLVEEMRNKPGFARLLLKNGAFQAIRGSAIKLAAGRGVNLAKKNEIILSENNLNTAPQILEILGNISGIKNKKGWDVANTWLGNFTISNGKNPGVQMPGGKTLPMKNGGGVTGIEGKKVNGPKKSIDLESGDNFKKVNNAMRTTKEYYEQNVSSMDADALANDIAFMMLPYVEQSAGSYLRQRPELKTGASATMSGMAIDFIMNINTGGSGAPKSMASFVKTYMEGQGLMKQIREEGLTSEQALKRAKDAGMGGGNQGLSGRVERLMSMAAGKGRYVESVKEDGTLDRIITEEEYIEHFASKEGFPASFEKWAKSSGATIKEGAVEGNIITYLKKAIDFNAMNIVREEVQNTTNFTATDITDMERYEFNFGSRELQSEDIDFSSSTVTSEESTKMNKSIRDAEALPKGGAVIEGEGKQRNRVNEVAAVLGIEKTLDKVTNIVKDLFKNPIKGIDTYSSGSFEIGGQTIKFQFPLEPNRASAFFSVDGKSKAEKVDYVGVRSNKGLFEKVQRDIVTKLNKDALGLNKTKEERDAARALAEEIQSLPFKGANLMKDKLFKAELSAKIEVDAYEGIVKQMGKVGSVENRDFLSKAYPLSKNYIALSQLVKRFATIGEGIFFDPVMITGADGKPKQRRQSGSGARASGNRMWTQLNYGAKEFLDFFKDDAVLQQSLAKAIAREMGIDVATDSLIENKMDFILNAQDATVAKIQVTELYKQKFITHIGRGGNTKKYSKVFEDAGMLFGMEKIASEAAKNDIIAAINSGAKLSEEQEAFLTHVFGIYTNDRVEEMKSEMRKDVTKTRSDLFLTKSPEEVVESQTSFLGALKDVIGEMTGELSTMSTSRTGGKEYMTLLQHFGYNSHIAGGRSSEAIKELIKANSGTARGQNSAEYKELIKLNIEQGVKMMENGGKQKLFNTEKITPELKLEVTSMWQKVAELSKEAADAWNRTNETPLVKEGKIPYKVTASVARAQYEAIVKEIGKEYEGESPEVRREAIRSALSEAFTPAERLAIDKSNQAQVALNKASIASFGALKSVAEGAKGLEALYMAVDIYTSDKPGGSRGASPETYFHITDKLIGEKTGNEHLLPFYHFKRQLKEAIRSKDNKLLDKDYVDTLLSGYVSLIGSDTLQTIGDMLTFPSKMFDKGVKIDVKSAPLPRIVKMAIATQFKRAAEAKVKGGKEYKETTEFKTAMSEAQESFNAMMEGKLSTDQIIELNNIVSVRNKTALEELFTDAINKMESSTFSSTKEAIERGNKLLKDMGYGGPKLESTGAIKNKIEDLSTVKKSKNLEDNFELDAEGVQKTREWEGEAVTYEKYLELKEENTKELFLPKRLADMIEGKKGAKAGAEVTSSKAYNLGIKKRGDVFVPYDSEDFQGLLYKLYGKGKQGDNDMAFMKEYILRPLYEAENDLSVYRMRLAEDYKGLEEQMSKIGKVKGEKAAVERVEKLGYNIDQATRVYIWTRLGYEIPGLSPVEQGQLMGAVAASPRLTEYAKGIMKITKTKEQYPKPSKSWFKSNIQYDLFTYATDGVRSDFLAEWSSNVDAMFHTGNLNKLEARFGSNYRYNLETMIKRIKNGRSRQESTNAVFNKSLNYINGSVATIMFLNMRSAATQTISAANYVNWTDNNPIAIGKAIASNPLLFAKNMKKVWNSDALKDRRSGLKINVEEAEIAKAIQAGGKTGMNNLWNQMVQFGFKPTQMADSFAITLGGTPFYMNRIKTYEKEGMSKSDAENKAWIDFLELTQESQQSSQMDRVSNIQTGLMGRLIFSFNNTPFQMSRLQKKAALDLINNRGDRKANVSRLGYYAFVQSTLFYGMQQAFYSSFMGDDDKDLSEAQKLEKYNDFEKRIDKIGTSVFQGILTGSGLPGKVATTLYNTGKAVKKQYEKGYGGKDFYPILKEMLAISPTLGSKANRLNRQWNSLIYSDFTKKGKAVKNTYSEFDPSNPNAKAYLGMVGTVTNIPIDRIIAKMENIQTVLDSNRENWQRVSAAFGTPLYQTQTKEQNERDRDKLLEDFYQANTPKNVRDKDAVESLKLDEQMEFIYDIGATRAQLNALTNKKERTEFIISNGLQLEINLEKAVDRYRKPETVVTPEMKEIMDLPKADQLDLLYDLGVTRTELKANTREADRVKLIMQKRKNKKKKDSLK